MREICSNEALEKIRETFKDVCITREVVEAVNLVLLQAQDPETFRTGIFTKTPNPGILIYGLPGTGKTLLVRAIAEQNVLHILSISGADLQSTFAGHKGNRIKGLFAFARTLYRCAIFIDEADIILRSRIANKGNQDHISTLNQFLAEMDGSNDRNTNNPIVIVASNRPFDIDEAVLRRLELRILIEMPDITCRKKILETHLASETTDPDLDFFELAFITKGYTGYDLQALVREAAIEAVREMHWGNIGPNLLEAFDQPRLPKVNGAKRVLRWDHFVSAAQMVRRLVPKSDLVAKFEDFHNEFGSVGRKPWPTALELELTKKTNEVVGEFVPSPSPTAAPESIKTYAIARQVLTFNQQREKQERRVPLILCSLCKGMNAESLFSPTGYRHWKDLGSVQTMTNGCAMCELISPSWGYFGGNLDADLKQIICRLAKEANEPGSVIKFYAKDGLRLNKKLSVSTFAGTLISCSFAVIND